MNEIMRFRLPKMRSMLAKYRVRISQIKALLMCIKSYLFLAVPFMMAIFVGCRSTSVHTIPDAPPPYPSFPVPQERYNSAQVYGGQTSNVPYVPPYSSPPTDTKVSPPSFIHLLQHLPQSVFLCTTTSILS